MNWGKAITIAIIAFMAFILGLVYKASQTNTDLESEDYYVKELSYQSQINARKNTGGLEGRLKVQTQGDSVVLEFPSDCKGQFVIGTIHFFRPDNAALDKHYPLRLQNNYQKFWKGGMARGHYSLKVHWEMNGQKYLVEESIEIQ